MIRQRTVEFWGQFDFMWQKAGRCQRSTERPQDIESCGRSRLLAFGVVARKSGGFRPTKAYSSRVGEVRSR